MKKTKVLLSTLLLLSTLSFSLFAECSENDFFTDITNQIPEINTISDFQKIADVAQYGGADWSQVIGIAKQVTPGQAAEIARKNPEITYFFHVKGNRMVLETGDGNYRLFRRGDAVFFAGEPYWGSAPNLADGYVKIV